MSSERHLAQFQKKVAKAELSGVLFWLGDERKRDEIEIVERVLLVVQVAAAS